jgi:hypothetical protein
MIDESILRRQLATTKTVFDWMKSFEDEVRTSVEEIKKRTNNVMFINMTSMDDFKQSVAEFKRQHPDANIQATGFVFSTKEPEKNDEITYPEVKTADIQEVEMKAKATKKAKPKVAKKSKTAKKRQK